MLPSRDLVVFARDGGKCIVVTSRVVTDGASRALVALVGTLGSPLALRADARLGGRLGAVVTRGADSALHVARQRVVSGLALLGSQMLFVAPVASRTVGADTITIVTIVTISATAHGALCAADALHAGGALSTPVLTVIRVVTTRAEGREVPRVITVESLWA